MEKDYNIGFFVSDASFNKSNKMSTVSVVDMIKKENISFNKLFHNTKEAELFGIIEAIKWAYSLKYSHVITMCDNINSVEEVNGQLEKTDYWKSRFNSVQVIWIPRTHNFLADFFSKNIPNSDKEAYIKIKSDKYIKDISMSNVSSLVITNKDKIKIFYDKIDQLIEMYPEIIKIEYSCDILKKSIRDKSFDFNDNLDIDILKSDILKIMTIYPGLMKKQSCLYFIMEFILNESKY